MDDIEMLGRIGQLRNHFEACDRALTEQRLDGKTQSDVEEYSKWCVREFRRLRQESMQLSDRGLNAIIQAELNEIAPLAIAASLGLPREA